MVSFLAQKNARRNMGMIVINKNDWIKLSLRASVSYLLLLTISIIAGVEYFSDTLNAASVFFWLCIFILTLPCSIFSGFLGIASLHSGSYSIAQLSLFLCALCNSFIIYFIVKRWCIRRYQNL